VYQLVSQGANMIKSLQQLGRKSTLHLSLLVALLIAGGISTPAHASTTYNELISVNSLPNQPKCLTLDSSSYDDGTTVGQSDCQNDPDQNWFLQKTSDGYYNIVSAFNAKCLDVFNYSHNNGASVVTWHCIPGAMNQEWDLGLALEDRFTLEPRHSYGKCLDVFAYSHLNGSNNVVQWDCLYGLNQLWELDS
jgi:Ricin-type beta-trefoil lectin domain-like